MKRFTVPIDCSGKKTPYHVYLWDAESELSPIQPKFDWIKQARGCTVPEDVPVSFEKLFKIARANKVSYPELTVYALDAAHQADRAAKAD